MVFGAKLHQIEEEKDIFYAYFWAAIFMNFSKQANEDCAKVRDFQKNNLFENLSTSNSRRLLKRISD